MKILLKKKFRPEFLKADGTWTSSIHEGLDFITGSAAIECVGRTGLKDTEILYVFPETTRNFCIPIQLGNR